MNKLTSVLAGVIAIAGLAASQPAAAFTVDDFISVNDPSSALFFQFCVIEGNGLPNAPQSEIDQLDFGLAVTVDGDSLLFEFFNNSAISSSIADIYFDDSTSRGGNPLIANGAVNATAGTSVVFSVGPGAPPNLPAGNNLDPDFQANTALSSHAANPSSSRGLNPGEHLVLAYDYLIAPELVGAALLDGTLRVGLHVQSIGNSGQSDAFFMKPFEVPPPPQTPVPEPATLLLLGMGTGFLALRKRIYC